MLPAARSTVPEPPNEEKSVSPAVSEDVPVSYTDVVAMLYAQGVGFGSDPRFPREFAYAHRQPLLKTVPTLATMLIGEDFPGADGRDGGWAHYVEQKLELFRPLPMRADLIVNRCVVDETPATDGNAGRIVVQVEARLASDDTALFALGGTLASAAPGVPDGRMPGGLVTGAPPQRDPDLSCDIRARTDQSLLFSLSGDHDPLYADPAAARDAGFDRPLLQSRCVLGIACRAILRTICDYDYTLIKGIEARFPAPVHPGEVITTDMWQERNIVSFRCSVKARGAVVVSGGRCTLLG